jgi:hypothetical protein
MKHYLLIPVTALLVAALACSPITINISKLTTGPTETFTVSVPAPEDDTAPEVSVLMGAGELRIDGGGEGLVSGEIKYNVADWEPRVTTEANGNVTIKQGQSDEFSGLPDGNVVNKWNLALGDAPMNLTVEAGAFEGTLNLGGVPLRNLTIKNGASDSTVTFEAANPEEMDKLVAEAGAASLTLSGLANANFSEMEFNGGVGDYVLDFSGTLQRDATVKISSGVSSLRVIVLSGTAAAITVTGGLNDVSTEGTWTVTNDVYSTGAVGPTLTIDIQMGVGSLTLASK